MRNFEMSKEFDILYDNIASSGAPGLNNYEKSVFLTKAQDEIVKSIYSPYNETQKSFESSENRRIELKELVKPYVTTSYFTSTYAIDNNSKFIEIPNDVYYILQEELKVTSTDSCVNGTKIKVIPITHDEYSTQKDSPFRKPNKRKAWRMDVSKINSKKVVEIITPFTPSEYKMRYIKEPSPIILSNFESDPELVGLGLTINNLNVITECELNSELHRNIIDRAVELAIRSYRENTLQSNVELNRRNV